MTSEVTATRLRDEIRSLAALPTTTERRQDTVDQSELMDITLPGTSFSIQTLASQVVKVFGVERQSDISGEFTIENNRLRLHLRLGGKPFFVSAQGADPNRPEDLMNEAARAVLGVTQPYILALIQLEIDKNYNSALATAESMISGTSHADVPVSWVFTIKGMALADLGRMDEAATEYEKAIASDPKDPYPHYDRGGALLTLGRMDEALTEYDKAVNLDPKFADAHNGRGTVLRHLGRAEVAMTEYNEAVALDPKSAYAYCGRSYILRDLGHPDEAMIGFEKAIALDPKFAEPVSGRGYVLRDLKHPDEAMSEFEKAIALDPKFADPHNGRGATLRDLGRTDEAIAEFKMAIALDPMFADPHYNMGLLLNDLGRGDEAKAEFDEAHTLALTHVGIVAYLRNVERQVDGR